MRKFTGSGWGRVNFLQSILYGTMFWNSDENSADYASVLIVVLTIIQGPFSFSCCVISKKAGCSQEVGKGHSQDS